MGGSIQAFSPALVPGALDTENGGSTFRVVLPEYIE
jgi:hypothetical protein